MLSIRAVESFQEIVWGHYHENARGLPWRRSEPDGSFDPYKILVSEMMLQQTQVVRVVPKYESFLGTFPSVELLAQAPLQDVINAWQGLGYSRRARFLREAAKQLAQRATPWELEDLVACKGIGVNTASAVVVYAFDRPLTFVETNIRTVYIHHFFTNQEDVTDKDILALVEQTMDREHPREWYWALMDYGSYLKKTLGNLNSQSKHYSKQSQFEGSARQIRGKVLKELASGEKIQENVKQKINDTRFELVLESLIKDGLVAKKGDNIVIPQ